MFLHHSLARYITLNARPVEMEKEEIRCVTSAAGTDLDLTVVERNDLTKEKWQAEKKRISFVGRGASSVC